MTKKALGKGLGALMESNSDNTQTALSSDETTRVVNEALEAGEPVREGIVWLPLDEILQNPWQPRQSFDEEKLQELASSIKEHGVVQPIIVTKALEGYRLIVGERRCRASRLAGLDTIPAIVRDCADQQMLEVALIENLQRQDLNPIEEAQAFQYLLREHDLTHEQLATRMGCSRPAISNALRLLTLPDEIRQDLIAGIIKPGHARAILSLDDDNMRLKAWKRIIDADLSVRQAEALAVKMAQGEPVAAASKPPRAALDANWQEILEALRERLNADVRITPKSKGKGRLEIHYRSQEELENLVELLFYRSSR